MAGLSSSDFYQADDDKIEEEEETSTGLSTSDFYQAGDIDDKEVAEQDSNALSNKDFYQEGDVYVPPTTSTVQDLGYVSTESRLTDIRETPLEPTSIKNLEQDDTLVADILQYRKDRYGQALDAKSDNILFGKLFGGQELTNENVVDDFMDNYRFISGNSLDAATEISWLKSLQQKEEEASKLGTEEGVKKANQYAEQTV